MSISAKILKNKTICRIKRRGLNRGIGLLLISFAVKRIELCKGRALPRQE